MESTKKYQLVLASQSPRRKELLGWIDVPFIIESSDVEEITNKTIPSEVAEDLAKLKGVDIMDKILHRGEIKNPFIISSDTIVTLGDKIYGKPKGVESAREMLKELSNKTHQVVTAVYMAYVDLESGERKEKVFSIPTMVTFDEITDDLLDVYLKSGDSLDKAGSYGIQGQGLTFIKSIEGSYSNVVGFPLNDFINELKLELGVKKDSGEWRDFFYRA